MSVLLLYPVFILPSPTIAEFTAALLERPVAEIVDTYLFAGEPFAFRDQPTALATLRDHLSRKLSVQEGNITIVGSAQIGFSLSPDTFSRPFSDQSDIDVLVVDEKLFDQVWSATLRWHYPRRLGRLDGPDWEWAKARQKDFYWGWLSPSRIRFNGIAFPEALKPVRDVSTNWFNAFKSLTRHRDFSRRDISGRLYRTWDHARYYHESGLLQIRATLTKEK